MSGGAPFEVLFLRFLSFDLASFCHSKFIKAVPMLFLSVEACKHFYTKNALTEVFSFYLYIDG